VIDAGDPVLSPCRAYIPPLLLLPAARRERALVIHTREGKVMNRLFAAGCFVLLGLGLLLVAPAQGQDTDNPAAKKTNLEKHGRHKLFLKRNEENKHKGKVIFLGDSITEGWESNGKAAWKQYFEEFDPVNLGISGDRTGGVLWRITDGKEIEKLEPKAAVIMIGTNNLSGGHTPEQIAGGIKAIVDELKTQKPKIKVLVLGVFPRAGKGVAKGAKMAKADQLQPKVNEINERIAKFADDKQVFYKDVGKEFLDKDGNLTREIMYDFLHLTPKGYEIWGKAIRDDVEKLVK
jgi:lysophospholipase L1-like esterase